MDKLKQLQRTEADNRLELLVKLYDLNPNLIKYWNDGKLYYSYLTGGGFLASIDTITYDPRYQKIVKEYEDRTGNLVFHVIESGHLLNLLYISAPEADFSEEDQRDYWDSEFIEELNCISAYVFNLNEPNLSEHGDIFLASCQGVLVRTQ